MRRGDDHGGEKTHDTTASAQPQRSLDGGLDAASMPRRQGSGQNSKAVLQGPGATDSTQITVEMQIKPQREKGETGEACAAPNHFHCMR